MKIPLYQIDAFTNKVFSGNPAAVCPLEHWFDDNILQSIAAENNLSETAFFVKTRETFELRWFTPVDEVDLCGHATLATAFVIFTEIDTSLETVKFQTKSGELIVSRKNDLLAMDFPSRPARKCEIPGDIVRGLKVNPGEVLLARDYLIVYESEEIVRSLQPQMELLSDPQALGVIVTAPGDSVDFVSRFFVPKLGIPEDPVTGSAHCTLIPYWAERLGKDKLHALQVSQRGGELFCELQKERVKIAGKAVKYLEGVIEI